MSTVMQFGSFGQGNVDNGGFVLIGSGYLSGVNGESVKINLDQHQMYVLFTREITISSGNVRGFRARLLARTENDGAVSGGNMYASTNSGVTITANADETLTIKPSSTSYDVYYSLYAVM